MFNHTRTNKHKEGISNICLLRFYSFFFRQRNRVCVLRMCPPAKCIWHVTREVRFTVPLSRTPCIYITFSQLKQLQLVWKLQGHVVWRKQDPEWHETEKVVSCWWYSTPLWRHAVDSFTATWQSSSVLSQSRISQPQKKEKRKKITFCVYVTIIIKTVYISLYTLYITSRHPIDLRRA